MCEESSRLRLTYFFGQRLLFLHQLSWEEPDLRADDGLNEMHGKSHGHCQTFTHVICSALICRIVSVFSEDCLRERRLNHSIFPPSRTSARHFFVAPSHTPSSFHLFLINTRCQERETLLPEESAHTPREAVKQSISRTVRVWGSHRRDAVVYVIKMILRLRLQRKLYKTSI